MIKILDSTPLIAFYYDIDASDVLHKISNTGYKIRIPLSVYGEITGKTFQKLKNDVENGKVGLFGNVNQSEFVEIKNRYPGLANGEIETIVWGLDYESKNKKYYCVLDDKLARKVAQKKGIIFTGTLGLIGFLAQRKKITLKEKDDLITKLRKSRFRM